MRPIGDVRPTLAIALVLLVGVLGGVGCKPGHERPTCSAADGDCGSDWECVDRESLEACVAVVIPYPCTQTRYLCVAQGILAVGEICLGDGECNEGLYCSRPADGSERTCTVPQCATRDDCRDGLACRAHECEESLDRICGEGFECARGQYCSGGYCDVAPVAGGNPCAGDPDCAAGRSCVERPGLAGTYCSECASDDECSGHEAGPFCFDSFCERCSDASCGDRVCHRERGCVDCNVDADCPSGARCSQYVCRQICDFPSHDQCASGHCDVGDLCVLPVGTACSPADRYSAAECGEGSCVGLDAAGAEAEPYCTRTCGSSYPPCPAGFACVEGVDVGGIRDDLCLAL